jgi:hypothetical protein
MGGGYFLTDGRLAAGLLSPRTVVSRVGSGSIVVNSLIISMHRQGMTVLVQVPGAEAILVF